jgi:hypothetical protein
LRAQRKRWEASSCQRRNALRFSALRRGVRWRNAQDWMAMTFHRSEGAAGWS